MVNIMSSTINTLWQPLERLTAGLVMLDKDLILEGTLLSRHIVGGLFDVVKLTGKGSKLTVEQISESSPYVRMSKAFMENRPITTAQGIKDVDRTAAISAQGWGMNPATSLLNYYRLKPVGWVTLAKQIHSVNAKTQKS